MNLEKLTSKKWFVITMLVLIFPYGVFLMWKNRVFKPNTRIIISIFFFLFVVGLFTENSHSNKEYSDRINQERKKTKTYDVNRIEASEETPVVVQNFSLEEGSSETIVLEYGKVGEYGKKAIYDGEEYIEYYLPTGNYDIVERKSKANKIYIESNSMHRNDEGFLENDIVNEVLLSECNNFDINDEYHITLTIGTKLKLKKGKLK